MAENEGMDGKDLAIEEKKEFEKRVLEAIQNLKEGQTTISTEGLEVTNNKGNYIIKLKGIPFGLISKDGKFTYNKENFKQVKKALEEDGITLEDLGLPDIEAWIDKQEQEEERETEQVRDEHEKDEEDLSKDMEEKKKDKPEKDEKDKKRVNNIQKDNNWQELDLDREFTNDNLRKFIKDVLKQPVGDRAYRVKTGSHDFKYVTEEKEDKTGETKYTELNLRTDYEGKNTRQQVYIAKEDGTLELDEVDSLLLSPDGNYGIATKIPDTGSSDMTKSFSVTRTKDGKYIATQLIEKSGQNRDPNLPGKEDFDRARGREEIGDTMDNVEEIQEEGLDISKDRNNYSRS